MRRRQGTGTIEERKQRNGSIRYMPRLPDKRRTPLGTFESREWAGKILDAAVYELAVGRLTTSNTLDAYAGTVFDQRELEGNKSVTTERERWRYVTGHEKLARKRWECADYPLEAIKRKDVVAWRDWLATLGLSRSTRKNALSTLRLVFAAAVDAGKLEHNPAGDVHVKGKDRPTMRPLTLEQLGALFWTADLEGKHLIAIAVGTCLRQGEHRSLPTADVHADRVFVQYGAPGVSTKSERTRWVPLFGFALEAMRSWRPPPNDRGLHFATCPGSSRKAGEPRRKGAMVPRKRWLAWLEAAGIDRRVRWHDLRHTGATLLLTGALGRAWSLEELKDLLGHSSIAVTERYARDLNLLAAKAAKEHGGGSNGGQGQGRLEERREPSDTHPDVERAREASPRSGHDRSGTDDARARDRRGRSQRDDDAAGVRRVSHSYATRHTPALVTTRNSEPPSRLELETYGLRNPRSTGVNSRNSEEHIDESGLAVVLDRAEEVAIALLERAVAKKDVSRRLVGLAGELLKTIDEARAATVIVDGWVLRR